MSSDAERFEIPIEPVPAGPIVPRSISELTAATAPAPPPAEATRDEAGPSALRPPAPEPARSTVPTRPRRARFTDKRHPVRATLALLTLVVGASIGLAAAIGLAIAVLAFAMRSAAG